MTTEDFKTYFAERGGKKAVKSSDPIWSLLIKHHNAHNKTKLTFSCGSCRTKAYRWLQTQ